MLQLAVMFSLLQNRLQGSRDRGATAVEYGLLVGLIAVAIVATLIAIGPQLLALFNEVLGGLQQANA